MSSSSSLVQTERNFRLTNALTFLPAFIMLLIHGILGGGAFPAVALVPLAISALLGLYLINPNALTAGGSSITLAKGHVAVLDVVLAAWLFIMCVCSWINVPRWRYDGGIVMLGTYGSVWVMVNCALHAYCALLHTPDLIAVFVSPGADNSHMVGQRTFKVQNGYVQLAREEALPKYQDQAPADYQRLP